MILHDFECERGHVFEKVVKHADQRVTCTVKLRNGHKCGKRAVVAFLSKAQRRLAEPIVFYKCADGQYSFPGEANARPPKDMVERIECRTVQEYDKAIRRVNDYYDRKDVKRRENLQEFHEIYHEVHRSNLRNIMANTNDNAARDMMRIALEQRTGNHVPARGSRLYSEAMEFDASNRERDPRGRK